MTVLAVGAEAEFGAWEGDFERAGGLGGRVVVFGRRIRGRMGGLVAVGAGRGVGGGAGGGAGAGVLKGDECAAFGVADPDLR